MTKTLVAIASALLLSGAAAVAAEWADFKSLDTDGSGKISRVEWDKNVGKLKLDPAPVFSAMDTDDNNGIDEDEWAAAEKLAKGYTERCREASASWCKDAK
ncbi:hypothetical protein GCM10008171_26050 [Methylopila jiangsuensis]|uniref:EF-hand domain-containing protein n=1 Tax=Methylopila jiangsuensis TaxID=586230 RepID=A0A9W6N4L4_9HYPH|nr:hypothetical protein [Methylopila jiangsuensis]MDR6285258.1 hypothetical protein [Methylopila jiangsuensis]GLK77351.1 hypothetical protein GCM10008171_26050 [Methylopila jiangsuensis]